MTRRRMPSFSRSASPRPVARITSRFDDLAAREPDALGGGPGLDLGHPADEDVDALRDLCARHAHDVLVEHAVVLALGAVEDLAAIDVDDLVEAGRFGSDGVDDPEPAQQLDLDAGE